MLLSTVLLVLALAASAPQSAIGAAPHALQPGEFIVSRTAYRDVGATVLGLLKRAIDDPESATHADFLEAKRLYETLDQETFKNNSVDDEMDPYNHPESMGRELSECTDWPKWKDVYGYKCKDHKHRGECGGKRGTYEDGSYYYPMNFYSDKNGNSPMDACCICGGGVVGGVTNAPTASPTANPDFLAIENQIRNAPENGTMVTIEVSIKMVMWSREIVIKRGQYIHIVGKHPAANVTPVLDAEANGRHFFVEEGATFSAENLVFANGKKGLSSERREKDGGAIYSEGLIALLKDCTFRGNSADYGAAIALFDDKSAFKEIVGCVLRTM